MLNIRPITPKDNPAMAGIIRTVMTEYGATGPGYSIHDPEVDRMFETYNDDRSVFYVVENDRGEVLGGAGIGPLVGGADTVCELKKMYFLPAARGQGAGHQMLGQCLRGAATLGYRQCYLETLERMPEARRLYTRYGFRELSGPMGNTGHNSCDRFFLIDL